MNELIKTLTTASPLQKPFHDALDAAGPPDLKAALEADGIKPANRRAISNRIALLEAAGKPPETPQEPRLAEAAPEAATNPKPSLEVATGLPTSEELISQCLDDMRSRLAVLESHGWTEGDMIAALSEMLPGRSKVDNVTALHGSPREERFPASLLLGELIAAATRQLKLCMTPWNIMPEDKQREVLVKVRQDCEKAARSALRTFSSEARTNFIASVDSVAFKPSGIKVALTVGLSEYAHLLADRAGDEVLIVLTENFDQYSGTGSSMRVDPDQIDAFGG